MTQRSSRKVSPDAVNGIIADVSKQSNKDSKDAGFCGEPFADNGELLSSLSPLLFSMKLFGLYFHREDRLRRRADDPECNPAASSTGAPSTWLRIYATIVLILVWFNAVRLLLLFTITKQFGAVLLTKIMFFSWFGLIAMMYTASYVACHTGKLLKVLTTIRVTQDCIRGARRAAVVLTAMCWISIALDMAGVAYLVFINEEYDFLFTPFVTHVPVSKERITVVKVVGYLAIMYSFPAVFFSRAMCLILVYVFYSQYKKMKKNFSRTLGEEGQFNGDLSGFRRPHRTSGCRCRK